jgi:hypothetical protein
MQKSMKPSSTFFPAPARADEILRKRPSLPGAGDLEPARQPAQEKKPAGSLADKKLAAPAKGFKGGRPPDFDIDGGINWVGRTI